MLRDLKGVLSQKSPSPTEIQSVHHSLHRWSNCDETGW